VGKLSDRTALVTGGGSGIGLAVARAFLDEGARVVITGRDEAKLRRAADALAAGDRLGSFAADVADPAQVERLADWARGRLGWVDVLVNNAGLNIKERAFRQLTPDRWEQVVRANLDGAFYCARAVLPGMRERGDGLIVWVSSVAAKRPGPLGGAAYAVSKAGMSALGLCLGVEERDAGVRVSVIYPGEVDTPILEARPQAVTPEQRRQILQPEDVAAAVLFVATLPPRVSVPELVIMPARHGYA
jgi:NAD(P)-dependent dehydrogenase (short-subunit alcohol dehydrogenase family)